MDKEFFSVKNLIKTELPPLPGNVLRISGMLGDMNVSQNAIAQAISLDPILASRILRLANSAAFGLERHVSSLRSAVSAIGNNSIYKAIMISGISDSFGRKILNSAAGKAIWIHLLSTAMAASDLCRLANLRGADEAFSCGLLHDIGKLILLRADAPFYTKILEQAKVEGDLASIEREVFGFDHAALGAVAAEAWNLPETICNMIRYHHDPLKAASDRELIRIVNIADTLVYLKAEGKDLDHLLCSEVALGFGFSQSQFDALWEDLLVRLDDVSITIN